MVNPSPYMIYLQARGSILVASSPEILCRVGEDRTVTNRRAAPAACNISSGTFYPANMIPSGVCYIATCSLRAMRHVAKGVAGWEGEQVRDP